MTVMIDVTKPLASETLSYFSTLAALLDSHSETQQQLQAEKSIRRLATLIEVSDQRQETTEPNRSVHFRSRHYGEIHDPQIIQDVLPVECMSSPLKT